MIYHKTEAIAKSFYLFFYVCQNFCFDCIHYFFLKKAKILWPTIKFIIFVFYKTFTLQLNYLVCTAYLLVIFCWKKGIEWHLLVNCARYFCCYTLHMILLHKLFRTHDFFILCMPCFWYNSSHWEKKAKAILFGNIVLIHNENLKYIFLYSTRRRCSKNW